jgi:tripartite-type tricarboxylate transporter receptor subunit TctC
MRTTLVSSSALRRILSSSLCSVLCTGAMLGALPALAQQWPEKPITIVACFPPGGGTDAMSRFVNTPLQEALGKPVVVENRAGASGNIAIQAVARTAPDGYTILGCSSSYALNPSLLAGASYDPLKDFIPLMLVGASPNILVVPAGSPHKTMKELIAFAKDNPGKLNWTSAGAGTTAYLGTEYMKQQLGLQMVHVPFTGAGPATQAAVAGQVDLYASAIGTIQGQIDGGQLRPLAITSRERWKTLPDVPTLIELGIKDAEFDTFQSLFLPAGTPKPIVDRLSSELSKLLANPELKARIEKSGLPVLALGPDAFLERLKREVPFYKDIIDKGGLKPKQ